MLLVGLLFDLQNQWNANYAFNILKYRFKFKKKAQKFLKIHFLTHTLSGLDIVYAVGMAAERPF